MVPVLYTIHDATGHDSKFEGVATWLKHKILIHHPQQRLIKNTTLQITNSLEQQRQIKMRYPYHKVHYAPFPSLVAQDIIDGNVDVPELKGAGDGYILFFGNLQLYKGVHLLYDAYLSSPALQQRPLVIAGSGYIYFKRNDHEPGNVMFINRFIDDSELKSLFTRAAMVVYPYISARQSGVTSIASYFDKPMVVSDLPFFKQTCEGCDGIIFFPSGDSEALADAISHSLQAASGTRHLYDREYAPHALRAALEEFITTV